MGLILGVNLYGCHTHIESAGSAAYVHLQPPPAPRLAAHQLAAVRRPHDDLEEQVMYKLAQVMGCGVQCSGAVFSVQVQCAVCRCSVQCAVCTCSVQGAVCSLQVQCALCRYSVQCSGEGAVCSVQSVHTTNYFASLPDAGCGSTGAPPVFLPGRPPPASPSAPAATLLQMLSIA